MNSHVSPSRGANRSRSPLILAFAFALGIGIAMPGQPVLAGVDGASKAQSGVAADSGSRGAIVVAERDGGKNWGGGKNWAGGKGWNDGKKNWKSGRQLEQVEQPVER